MSEIFDKIDAIIERVAENLIGSGATDTVKTNAKFSSDAGMKCYIIRKTNGKCCEWCDSLVGTYVYGEEPHEVFRRHDNCTCTVLFKEGKKLTDVHSKKEYSSETEAAIARAKELDAQGTEASKEAAERIRNTIEQDKIALTTRFLNHNDELYSRAQK